MSEKPIKFEHDKVKTETLNFPSEDFLSDNTVDETSVTDDVLQPKAKQLPVIESGVKLRSNKPKSKWLKIFGLSFSGLIVAGSIYQAWQFVAEMFSINTPLGTAVSALLTVVVASGIGALISGRLKRKRLNRRKLIRAQLASYQSAETFGQAESVLDSLSQEFQQELDISKPLALYRQKVKKTHNDPELMQIYNDQVLTGLDKLALEAIHRHAAESALMVSLSPLAVADMALVAWRSNRMIQEVSRIYGCPQTAFGRLGLSKQVMTNLMLAGASEFVAEAGIELLGKSVAATISTRAAQGIGVGILVSRLGIQTMRLCRPIEFDDTNRPKLSDIRKVLTQKVVAMIKAKPKDKNLQQGEKDD